eukprot:15094305-Ditylum_brightwellii.AAC.1
MSVGKVVGETWEERWCSKKGRSLPLYLKGGRLVGTYLGGGGDFNKQDVFVVVPATVVFVVFVKK